MQRFKGGGNAASGALKLVLVLAAALLNPTTALAQGGCEAETDKLRGLASSVAIDVVAPADLRSGGAVRVAWRAPSRFPPKTPVFAAIAIPGEVRIEAQPAPRDKDPSSDTQAPDLPGVLTLPPAAAGPNDLAFGGGKTRLLVPLFQPGSKLGGSVAVRFFEAGLQKLEAGVVTKTACGERTLGETVRRDIHVAPGTPEIVVQDPYDVDVPKRIVIANSGRYRLHVFDGRYRVYELATGAKLVDRAGHNPNFSPTSRFLVADIGDDSVGYSAILPDLFDSLFKLFLMASDQRDFRASGGKAERQSAPQAATPAGDERRFSVDIEHKRFPPSPDTGIIRDAC